MAVAQFWGTGRRKNAVARVRLVPGTGRILINGRAFEEYFPMQTLQTLIMAPLNSVDLEGRFDVLVRDAGAGVSRHAGAARHGIARALLNVDHNFRTPLKQRGFLKRDSRMKERRKYGLKKARKAPQFSKR